MGFWERQWTGGGFLDQVLTWREIGFNWDVHEFRHLRHAGSLAEMAQESFYAKTMTSERTASLHTRRIRARPKTA